MSAANCLFCRIIRREIPSEVVYENEKVLGFRDIRPQAPVHALFIPKKHVAGVREIDGQSAPEFGDLVLAANESASKLGVSGKGYRLVVNQGADGGQTVDHLHVHLLGGRPMAWPTG
jgi:histidine triad (HIT) family protein